MQAENIELTHPLTNYHLIVRSLPQAFENALNQAVKEGWQPIPETFRIALHNQAGQLEYAILVTRRD